jgi:hypothetical protein
MRSPIPALRVNSSRETLTITLFSLLDSFSLEGRPPIQRDRQKHCHLQLILPERLFVPVQLALSFLAKHFQFVFVRIQQQG